MVVALAFGAAAVRADDSRRAVRPGDDLAKLAAAAPPGAVFDLAPGTYRVADIRPKDGQVFDGHGRAIISGAVVLSGFVRDGAAGDGGRWRMRGPKPLAPAYGACDKERWKEPEPADGCFYREDLFVDGRVVPRAFSAAAVTADTWYQDRKSGEIVVGFDPARHAVELSYAETAFAGNASGVVIRGLTVERFASMPQHGAIAGEDSSGWTIERDLIRDNAGAGVRTGNGMRVRNDRVLANGQIGVTGGGNGIVVADNEIAGNNTHGFSPAWEAGGTKFVRTLDLMVARNCVRDNAGSGLWTDIDNRKSTIIDNVSVDNGGVGIFHEIGGAALISGNFAAGNGVGDSPWASQILVSGSLDTEVRGNRVVVAADHGQGIFVVEEGRANELNISHKGPTYDASGNTVTGNEIRFLGKRGVYGFHAQGPAEPTPLDARNRFAGNTVIAGDDRPRFADQGAPEALSAAMAKGQEKGSKMVVSKGSNLSGVEAATLRGCDSE